MIRGPAIIGSDCVIESSFVGPYTSIQDRVELASAEIENSIVLEGSRIGNLNQRVEGSLIGRNVRIGVSDRRPKALRFMVGDNSVIGV